MEIFSPWRVCIGYLSMLTLTGGYVSRSVYRMRLTAVDPRARPCGSRR
jgi:hypothetical protein